MGVVRAVCVSLNKGTPKTAVDSVRLIPDHGIEGDAHAGKWHRQVSLLSYEVIQAFKGKGIEIPDGAFGENLIIEGYDLKTLPVGTQFLIGETRMELTQIGKECHSHCAIYRTVGECIMPSNGVFAKVLEGGTVQPGDRVEAILPDGQIL